MRRAPETNGLLATCQELGVALVAFCPLASGRLVSQPRHYGGMSEQEIRVVAGCRAVANRIGKTSAQVAINWVICKGAIPIAGASSPAHAVANARAVGWRLSASDVAELDALALDEAGVSRNGNKCLLCIARHLLSLG